MNGVAIVTGAGRGIGAATAKLLASRDYAVCVNYLNDHVSAEAVVMQIRQAGGKAIAIKADVSKENDVLALFERVEQTLGIVTHLVNNAGVLLPQSRLVDLDAARFNQMMQTNVTSCFLCSKTFIQRLQSSDLLADGTLFNSAIVNVSSAAARTGAPFEYIDYAASKGAMDSLTKGLSIEVAELGIRVNSVRPGFIHTQMHADGGEPERVSRLAPQIPLKRGGTPNEVANAIAWLLSEDASYVTGSFIDLAGGK
ncbi:SDR family oxidoreductase [uncultured Shewanella sp.]|uniref:SDR family oxidoreductase n=1 Tax=uncultured Shewanella sp. TaxID=173975 RepID=UPI0026177C87|nr:SDR family oxidoreductase [uncultured Shewanella sp.]